MKQETVNEIQSFLQDILDGNFDTTINKELFDDELELYQSLNRLLHNIKQANDIASDIVDGKLMEDYKAYDNSFAAPFKSIQSNLRHLAWMASRVSKGDYRQKVTNMGILTDAFNDMTNKLAKYSEEMERRLNTDYLTQLGNRKAYREYTNRLQDKHIPFALAYIDLDGMKICNDKFTHAMGDCYINQVAKVLEGICVEGDSVYRMGGDEFVFVSINDNDIQLKNRLEFARERIIDESKLFEGFTMDFSIGCVYCNYEDNKTTSDYLTLADREMYNDKVDHYIKKTQQQSTKKQYGQLDITGLDSRIFDIFSSTTHNKYLYICNLETNVSRWSLQAVEYFGLPGEYMQAADQIWVDYVHPEDRELYINDVQAVFSGKKKYHNIEYRARNKDGNYVICSCVGFIQKGTDGNPDLFAGTITNHGIVDNVDSITNIYNVYELLKQLSRLKKERKPIRIISVGIHQFSDINMGYGYQFGNRVLQQLAKGFQKIVSGVGQVYRIDGVKFAFVLGEFFDGNFDNLYNKIVDMARNDIYVDDRHIIVELSGASLNLPYADVKVSTLHSQLVYSLSQSKKQGLGKLLKQEDTIQGTQSKDIELYDKILKSISNEYQGFYLVYQPQVDTNGKCVGVEALLRWKDEDYGLVSPARYIPFLEKHPTFYIMGLWILKTAMRQMKPFVLANPEIVVSVNISYRQIEHHGFRDDVMALVASEKFPAKNLGLELTEHCQTLEKDILQKDIRFFQQQGIRIHADDFGTGYSSFSLMKDLMVDCIKIDRSFIVDILESKSDRILVEAAINWARELGIKVCIEGVETKEIIDFLKGYHPDIFQGFYYSKPLELIQLASYLETNS